MPKNILIVARWPVGGIRTYIKYIYDYEALTNYGYTLLTPALRLKDFYGRVFRSSEFDYIESKNDTRSFFLTVVITLKKLKPDLVHSHGLTAGVLVSPVARLFSVPHVLTTHDVFLPGQFSGIKGAMKKRLIDWVLRGPQVINPCGFDASNNLKLTFPNLTDQQVQPIRNGIDVASFSLDKTRDLKSELNLDDDVFLVGFFGRFMRQKGFDLLISAIDLWRQKQSDKKIHVVCFGWGAYIREEQENIKNLGLSDSFSFMPQTDDMPSALRGVDAAIMPSRWEACPLLPMEAMVAGTVVVASDCIGMKEVCCSTPAVVFKQENVTDLYQKLDQVSNSIESHEAAAKKYMPIAAKQFDSNSTAQSLADLYDRLLTK